MSHSRCAANPRDPSIWHTALALNIPYQTWPPFDPPFAAYMYPNGAFPGAEFQWPQAAVQTANVWMPVPPIPAGKELAKERNKAAMRKYRAKLANANLDLPANLEAKKERAI